MQRSGISPGDENVISRDTVLHWRRGECDECSDHVNAAEQGSTQNKKKRTLTKDKKTPSTSWQVSGRQALRQRRIGLTSRHRCSTAAGTNARDSQLNGKKKYGENNTFPLSASRMARLILVRGAGGAAAIVSGSVNAEKYSDPKKASGGGGAVQQQSTLEQNSAIQWQQI